MKKYLGLLSVAALAPLAFTSCQTAAGTGAATGAVTGAVVGGPVGAAVGAAAGAIVGASVAESEVRTYGPAPSRGWPVAAPAGQPGMYTSPYTGKLYDLRGVPHGSLVRDQDTNKLFRKP
jgi:hypothetical protein